MMWLVALVMSGCLFSGENRAPVASFVADPLDGYEPLTVTFNAADSYDPDGQPLTYEWSFGDGATGAGRATTHSYDAGTYVATLTVTDTRGATATETLTIDIEPVPDGYLGVQFEWSQDAEIQYWNVLIPEGLYDTYSARVREPIADTYDYGAYVEDPLDDPTLEDLADDLWERAGRGYEPFAETVLAFVQGAIAYQPDPVGSEWPLYPIETLVEAKGDCEDTAILFVSLIRARGYSSKIAFVDTDTDGTPDHVLALVPVPTAYLSEIQCSGTGQATVLWYSGSSFVVAETAVSGEEIPLGCDPWGLDSADIITIWEIEP